MEGQPVELARGQYFSFVQKGVEVKYNALQKATYEIRATDNKPDNFKIGRVEVRIPLHYKGSSYDQLELDSLMNEKLGFSLSEIVYWINSTEFKDRVSLGDMGVKNPENFHFEPKSPDFTKTVRIMGVYEHEQYGTDLIEVEGNIEYIKGGKFVEKFGFTVTIVKSSGNHTWN